MERRNETTFGALLKRYREAAGVTQEELGAAAGVSVDAISTLERGVRRAPRPDTLRLLLRALDVGDAERTALEAAVQRRRGPRVRSAAPGDPVLPRRHPSSGPPVPPLVGRHHELTVLADCLSGAGPPLLLFAGEPGIGKSRLLHEAVVMGAAQGWQVLRGGCQRRGGQEPYAPVLEALESAITRQTAASLRMAVAGCAWLVRLLPELAAGPIEPLPAWAVPPEREWRLVVGAVRRLLQNVAGPTGTLLVLDDLQWASPDALDLLLTLVRSAAEIPLCVMGAYRDTEIAPDDPLSLVLADLAQARLARQVTLAPLEEQEARELLAVLLEGRDGARAAERVAQRTGGVPFFLVSYAQALREATREEGIVPWDVAQGLRQRVTALPRGAWEILSTASLIGRVVPHALLIAVMDLPERDVLAGLEAASRARLVVSRDGHQVSQFAHDVIREAIEADVPEVHRQAVHRRIAAALERHAEETRAELPCEALAYHYGRGGVPGKAVLYLEQAADRAAAQYANAAAESHYRDLVARLEEMGHTREEARAREKRAVVLMRLGRYDAALAALEKALETHRAAGDREGQRSALVHIVDAHTNRFTVQEGLKKILPLVEALDPGDATAGWAALHVTLANLFLHSGRYADAVAASVRATALARALGDQTLLSTALQRHGQALLVLNGRRAECRIAVEEACRVAEEAGNLTAVCGANGDAAWIALESGEFEAAARHIDRAHAAAERQSDLFMITDTVFCRGLIAYYRGDWQTARQDIMGVDHTGNPYYLLQKGRLRGAEGDGETARRYLEESSELAVRINHHWILRAAQKLLAEHDLEEGHPAAALDRLAALLARPGVQGMDMHEVLPVLAWAHMALGNVEAGAVIVAQASTGMRADNNVLDLVDALRVQALVATRQGCWAEAEDALEAGLSHARRMPYPYAEGQLLRTWGLVLRDRGEAASARMRLEAALGIFGQLGARARVEEARQALAALMQT